ncbi:P-loop containing nucleoside triphosphate hydrolase protein [Cryphonectria parasitica EP155]|uniref:Ribosome assembly protein 1 n=1 Tax=Cryphonectria parasitica (strain ATCC 38755 / EP155) TaxID=660469 RepID=A0A9P4YAQ9_CRYP1|nr:P-loop containing nucleoside triphosphate hydrolase protein [Cryphonectria parasitica EP155]KAF3769570.1 P-loop containing nucleoside triphosphate hydrolase protein [Cryphonectria parasitica EP155]
MPVVSPQQLANLQQHADNVRNICILAHVDHGKTSLTDALLATNGIISPRLAGKVRYLDSRPDEQQRGITMESSAISLYFSMLRRSSPDAAPEAKEYLINLIDSPGHIDFSSEVSTASRLCDGAVVLVDAVEGVCSQTVTVLRQTWEEKLKPLLVINKMDRLITELKMTPGEAYVHLSKLLEQVNAVLGSFFQGERMEEDLNWRERIEERVKAAAAKEAQLVDQQTESGELQFEERDDEDLYFAPEKNNVIFGSAIDGWAFTVRQFASLYEKKLGIKRSSLEKVLWGNFYLDPKTKKVLGQKHLKGRNLKPLFVQLVLEQVWAVYTATIGGDNGKGDTVMLEKIIKSLNITIPRHILNSRDPRTLLTTVFSSWLPLSVALLVSVVESLPSPRTAQGDRLPELLDDSPGGEYIAPEVRDAMVNFKHSKTDPVVVYVSKMVSIPESELPHNKRRGQLSPEEAREMARKKRAEAARAQAAIEHRDPMDHLAQALDSATLYEDEPTPEEQKVDPEHLIGFARIYSGVLSIGDEIYVLPPKFSPANPQHQPIPKKVTVSALYMLMGRSLESLDSVPAGVVFGIGGLEGSGILKTGTLCSQLEGAVNLAGVGSLGGRPIVRVALEPANPADLDKMIEGLKLLVQADACAEYEQFSSGEHVLLTAGELHLERCLTDLRERFARCEIQAGEAIVPYKETIVRAEEMKPPANKDLGRGAVVGVTSSKQVTLTLRVRPLPAEVTDFLEKNAGAIKHLNTKKASSNGTNHTNASTETDDESDDESLDEDINVSAAKCLSPEDFKAQLKTVLETGKGRDPFRNIVDNISDFGPRRVGANLLIDATREGCLAKAFETDKRDDVKPEAHEKLAGHHLSDKIKYGFQLATSQGPLCREPVQGIAVFIEDISITTQEEEALAGENTGRLTGEVIKTAQQSIHKGFLDWSPRLMLAMYSCEIQASSRVYDVLTRRRGHVLSEAMKEGTPFFTIQSVVPVAESFGFADEMRKRTSGAAQPQLIFAGFEILDEDPFWVPFTEEEMEDLGEFGDKENVAKRYMDKVRKKKGMLVEGRTVAVNAEKQKTLKR